MTFCQDDAAAVVKSEVVIVCAPKREMGTMLAPISQCTRGRTLVTVCDNTAVDLNFVQERTVYGTEVIAATLYRNEAGKLTASYEISHQARLFLHQPCRDLVEALCAES